MITLQTRLMAHPILCPMQVRAQDARPIADRCANVIDMAADLARFEAAVHNELNRLYNQPALRDAVAKVAFEMIRTKRAALDAERSAAYGQSEVYSSLVEAEQRGAASKEKENNNGI